MVLKDIREEKEEWYGNPVKGLKSYLFFWMPLLLFFYIVTIWGYFTDWNPGDEFSAIINIILAGIALFSWLTAFVACYASCISGIIHLILFFCVRGWQTIGVFQSIGDLGNTIIEIESDTLIPGFFSSIYGGIGAIFILGEIIGLLLIGIFCGYFLHMFIKNFQYFKYDFQDEKKHRNNEF